MPEVKDGFVEYSDLESLAMQEHGVCTTCDYKETCPIIHDNTEVMNAWRAHNKHIHIVVKTCEGHSVQGIKTFARRGE